MRYVAVRHKDGLHVCESALLATGPAGRGLSTRTVPSISLVIFASAGSANQKIGGFVPTGNLSSARAKAASILLSNGMVLEVGGDNSVNSPLPAELYNSSRGIFTLTGNPANDFFNPVAVNLRDGRVYVTDGNIANIYDPARGSFSSASSPQFDLNCLVSSGLSDTCFHAVTLKTGKVLLTDGTKADLYDPRTDTIATIRSPLVPRTSFSMTLLNSGKVLLAGGISGAGGSPPDAELYDPSTGLFNFDRRYDGAARESRGGLDRR